MTLLESIAKAYLEGALYCSACHRHGCSAMPCPVRRSARLHGYLAPKFVTRSEMGWDRHDSGDKNDIQPFERTTSYPWGGR